ncbi:MAG: DUF1963 domain-containing protein [Lewinellaceae bacterium]|nr:DUF1963 domain-containing protein [Lewinellaceae bacterium]
MIVLSVVKPTKFKPVKWDGESLEALKPGQSFLRFAGDHPDNAETGTIELKVELMQGDFDGITDILFVGSDQSAAKLLGHKKGLLGGYTIEIAFDVVFGHGLRYTTEDLFVKGVGIIGLSKKDKNALKTFEGQKNLLRLLLELILPSKQEEMLRLATPSFLLIPNDGHNENQSHFVGMPKGPLHTSVPKTAGNAALLHLATLHLSGFERLPELAHLKALLSFYIKATDTENGWPETPDTYRVLNYEKGATLVANDAGNYESASNFNCIPFLDLPRYDHSVLQLLNLSDDEQEQYDALESTYKNVVLQDVELPEERNKFLGYPDNVQGCVAYEAERIKNNREYSDGIYIDAADWRLILQISPYCKWFSFFDGFGDGTIYFMIRKKDLAVGNFDAVQVVVQNT